MKVEYPIKHILIIVAVCVGVVVLSGRIDPDEFPDWDLKHYRVMAAAAPEISDNIPKPFAYRLLGPHLAGLIPADDTSSFYALAVASALLLLVSFYMFLCNVGISKPAALYAVILLSFNWFFVGFNIWNCFQLNDLLALLSVVLSFWAMSRRNWVAFSVAVAIGVLARITPLAVIPTAFIYLAERRLLKTEGFKFLASATLPVLIFILLHALVPTSGGLGILHAFLVHTPRLADPAAWFGLLISPYAPLTLIPLVFVRQTVGFFRDKNYLLVFCAAIVLGTFQGANNERLVAPTFVVFYMLTAVLIERTPLGKRKFLIFMLVTAFLRGFYHLIDPGPLPVIESEVLASTVSTALLTAAAWWLKTSAWRSRDGA